MKTENYTTSAFFLFGFFGIFLLMNFQTSIAGTAAVSEAVKEDLTTFSVTNDILPDTLHWQKIE